MKFSHFVVIVILIIVAAIRYYYLGYNNAAAEVKTVEVQIPEQLVISVPQIFNLKDTEYVKQVINDVKITSYNNHTNQTDETPNITATGRPVREGIVAVSRDFLTKNMVKYGDLMYIDCFDRWYTIEDTMHERHNKHVDIFLFDKEQSLKINKKCNIQLIHITR